MLELEASDELLLELELETSDELAIELELELELESSDELLLELELETADELAIELDFAALLEARLRTEELASELLVAAILEDATDKLLEAFEDTGTGGSKGRELDCAEAVLLEASVLLATWARLELEMSTLEEATDAGLELTGFGATEEDAAFEEDTALLLEEGGNSLALSLLLPPPPPHALNTRLSDRTDKVLNVYKESVSMMVLLGLQLKSLTCQLQAYFY